MEAFEFLAIIHEECISQPDCTNCRYHTLCKAFGESDRCDKFDLELLRDEIQRLLPDDIIPIFTRILLAGAIIVICFLTGYYVGSIQ